MRTVDAVRDAVASLFFVLRLRLIPGYDASKGRNTLNQPKFISFRSGNSDFLHNTVRIFMGAH